MRARNWGTCTFLLYQTTGKFDTIPVISATTMEADHSWSSRSTPLNTSEKSDDSYGQPSDTETSPLLFNSNLSIGLTDKAPLLCNGTKATSITVLQSWKYVIAVVRGPQRLWSTTIAAIVAALSTLLSGYTLGYPSASLLQLNTLQDGFAIRNTSVLQDLFGVRMAMGGNVHVGIPTGI